LGLSAVHPLVDRRALGWDVSVFFTFYGLNLLRKDISDSEDQPARQSRHADEDAVRPEWFKGINWNIPNAVQAVVPGFETMATTLMKQTMQNKGVAQVGELRAACIEGGVNLIGCQMTVDLFGFRKEDFIPEVKGIRRRRDGAADRKRRRREFFY
jgi:peroxiredoxin family protein